MAIRNVPVLHRGDELAGAGLDIVDSESERSSTLLYWLKEGEYSSIFRIAPGKQVNGPEEMS